ERTGVAEHPALPVLLLGPLQEGLGDVFRAQRIARDETGLRVVAFLSSDMYWHAGYRPRQCRAWSSGLRSRTSSSSAGGNRSNGSSWRTWRAAASAASQRCVRAGTSAPTSSLRARVQGRSRSSPPARGPEC